MVLIFSEVHPFGSVTADLIAVDIVSPEEAAKTSKDAEPPSAPTAQPSDSFDLSATSAAPTAPAPAAAQQAAVQPQPQQPAALSPPRSGQQLAAKQPQPPKPPASTIIAQEPDLSIKYNVLLGLPQDKPGDGFDAPASTTADVASNLVTEFRRHLKTCSKLPESVAPSDSIKIRLRVFMTPDGRLATAPVLIEASASAKGPALMQSAIGALRACQPYAMLPADKYDEWKVLDLSFTPRDFTGAS